MNPIAILHLIAAGAIIAAAVPLIRKRIKMNGWYGVRIPEAFESEEAWIEINHYGGRYILWWGIAVAVTSMLGLPLEKKNWIVYDWISLVVILGGLFVAVLKTCQYARKRKTA